MGGSAVAWLVAVFVTVMAALGTALPASGLAVLQAGECQVGMIVQAPSGAQINVASPNQACPDRPGKPHIPADCAQMAGCLAGSVSPISEADAPPVIYEGAGTAYWVIAPALAGRTPPPDLSPPIALI